MELARSTVKKHVDMINGCLVPALGEGRKLRTVTTEVLVRAITSRVLLESQQPGREPVPISAGTMGTIASTAKKWFNWLLANGWMTHNPALTLPATWTKESSVRSRFQPRVSDVERLARAMDRVWRLPPWARDLAGPNGEGRGDFIRLLEYTGLRWEEFVALPAAYVFKRDRVLWVEDVATESSGIRDYRPGDGKTRARRRAMIILPEAIPVIERLDAIRKRGLALEPAAAERRRARGSRKRRNRRDEDLWKLLACGAEGGFISYKQRRSYLQRAKDLLRAELLAEPGVVTAHDQDMLCIAAHLLRHVNASMPYGRGNGLGLHRRTARSQQRRRRARRVRAQDRRRRRREGPADQRLPRRPVGAGEGAGHGDVRYAGRDAADGI